MTDNAKSPILSKNVSSSIGLEPPLRFPGFEGDYKHKKLKDIAKKIQRKDQNSIAPIMMLSAGAGFINQSEKYSRDNAGQSLAKYTVLNKGELAYNHGASKQKPFGCCYMLTEDSARIPYVYHCFAIPDNSPSYVATLLNNRRLERQLKKLISSSVRMDGLLNISYDEYMSVDIFLPSLAEQQKIADFLSLVDERIEKQRQLVEVLKRYKRGLLSLVFKGNFQMVKLADICDFVSSSHTISNLGARESGIYPVYDAAGLSMYIDTYDMHEEYISIVKDGSGIGRLQKCDKNSSFIGTLGALVAKNCEIDYLFAVLQTIDFSRFATGMAIPHIYYKDYKNTLIPLPSQDTQKNISRLFRNIDIHIEQNSIQLDNILVLKHGLLQQMFI